ASCLYKNPPPGRQTEHWLPQLGLPGKIEIASSRCLPLKFHPRPTNEMVLPSVRSRYRTKGYLFSSRSCFCRGISRWSKLSSTLQTKKPSSLDVNAPIPLLSNSLTSVIVHAVALSAQRDT